MMCLGPCSPAICGYIKLKKNKINDVTLVWDDGKRIKAHKEVEEVLGVRVV